MNWIETTYLIYNKTTGEFREMLYETAIEYDEHGKRSRVKRYYRVSGALAPNDGFLPNSLFETDPSARRNYLILGMRGTGKDTNHFSFSDSPDAGDTVMSVNTETVAGVIRNQKIRHDLGIVECLIPSSLAGTVSREKERYDADMRPDRPANLQWQKVGAPRQGTHPGFSRCWRHYHERRGRCRRLP